MSDLIKLNQAAEILGVSLRIIENWVNSGRIPAIQTTDGPLISIQSLSEVNLMANWTENSPKSTTLNEKLRILVVEDDPNLRKLYDYKFQSFPVPNDLYIATNGYRGLVMLGKSIPHVLITDLLMPGMDGFEMLRQIQSMREFDAMRIVVVTGMTASDMMQHGGLPEKVLIQSKPISFDAIEAILFQTASIRGILPATDVAKN